MKCSQCKYCFIDINKMNIDFFRNHPHLVSSSIYCNYPDKILNRNGSVEFPLISIERGVTEKSLIRYKTSPVWCPLKKANRQNKNS